MTENQTTSASAARPVAEPRHDRPVEHRPTYTVSVGLLLLRLALGITFLLHGWQKVAEWGLGGTAQSFEGMGVPVAGLAAVVAAVVELLGGIALILGVLTRIAGVLLALDMLGALLMVHAPNGFFATNGGIELVFVLAVAALALAFTGPGRYALVGGMRGHGERQLLA